VMGGGKVELCTVSVGTEIGHGVRVCYRLPVKKSLRCRSSERERKRGWEQDSKDVRKKSRVKLCRVGVSGRDFFLSRVHVRRVDSKLNLLPVKYCGFGATWAHALPHNHTLYCHPLYNSTRITTDFTYVLLNPLRYNSQHS
jgi:hypothetical protein